MFFFVDTDKNSLNSIKKMTFSQMGITEDSQVRDWFSFNPKVFGEELLIIQENYALKDFPNNLNLLALDSDGKLVVIENKVGDSGTDITWQAMKYTAYCAKLKKNDIVGIFQEYLTKKDIDINAEDKIIEFYEKLGKNISEIDFDNAGQRIIIAAEIFEDDAVSAVEWLVTSYSLDIKCFTAVPYSAGSHIILDLKQIIPEPENDENYINFGPEPTAESEEIPSEDDSEEIQEDEIEMDSENDEDKNEMFLEEMTENEEDVTEISPSVEETQELKEDGEKPHKPSLRDMNQEFWKMILDNISNMGIDIFNKTAPSTSNFIQAGFVMKKVLMLLEISKKFVRIGLYINLSEKDYNEFIYERLHDRKEELEEGLGCTLQWYKMENKVPCRIAVDMKINGYDKENWSEINDFFIKNVINFDNVFRGPLEEIQELEGNVEVND